MPASNAPAIIRSKIFAVAVGKNGTVFIEYGNNVLSDGSGGGSTIDPDTGKLWVVQNQDATAR